MLVLKRIAAGILLAVLLTFTIHSKAEAVADFKACWAGPAPESYVLVMYFSFVGEDTYSVNGKVLDPPGSGALFSGTAVFGATEIVGSLALAQTTSEWMHGELGTFTLDLATIDMTFEGGPYPI